MNNFYLISRDITCDLAKNLGCCVNINVALDLLMTKVGSINITPSVDENEDY
ncbi:MAG: hypothetical protein ACRCZ9_12045 [Fusobacteriaceae bacterium]